MHLPLIAALADVWSVLLWTVHSRGEEFNQSLTHSFSFRNTDEVPSKLSSQGSAVLYVDSAVTDETIEMD